MSEPSSPPRPNLENRRKQARTLLKAVQGGDLSAVERIRQHLPRLQRHAPEAILQASVTLQEAQHVIAGEHGFHGWTAMVRALTSGGTRSGLLESLTDGELRQMAEGATAEELAVALRATGERTRRKLRVLLSDEAWALVGERMEQIGPMRLSEVEQAQLRLVQRLQGDTLV